MHAWSDKHVSIKDDDDLPTKKPLKLISGFLTPLFNLTII